MRWQERELRVFSDYPLPALIDNRSADHQHTGCNQPGTLAWPNCAKPRVLCRARVSNLHRLRTSGLTASRVDTLRFPSSNPGLSAAGRFYQPPVLRTSATTFRLIEHGLAPHRADLYGNSCWPDLGYAIQLPFSVSKLTLAASRCLLTFQQAAGPRGGQITLANCQTLLRVVLR